MLQIKNKRLMGLAGIECKDTLPTADDFKFFGGGGGKGGGGKTKVVYVPQEKIVETIKQAPNPSTQDTATDTADTITTNEDEIIGGRKKTLGGTRKLTIPVTTSR